MAPSLPARISLCALAILGAAGSFSAAAAAIQHGGPADDVAVERADPHGAADEVAEGTPELEASAALEPQKGFGAPIGPPPPPHDPASDDPDIGPPAPPPPDPLAPAPVRRSDELPVPLLEPATPIDAVRATLGLVVLLALAYIGGRPGVKRIERRLRIAQMVTAGLPFVLLGMLASLPSVGVLSQGVLGEIAPVLPFGLGWLGFAAGFRFDVRLFEELPVSSARIVALTTLIPLLLVGAACGLLFLYQIQDLRDAGFVRDALLLGSAAMLTARSVPAMLRDEGGELPQAARLLRLIQLQEFTALIGLLLVSSFFRPPSEVVGWKLPGLAWLFVAIGLAGAMGAVIYAALAQFRSATELAIVLIAAVGLTAGLASHLRLAPVAVCFLSGIVLANVPALWKEAVRNLLTHMERPIYMIFLVIAGALWSWGDWQGWVLLLLFVPARLMGKTVGAFLSRRGGDDLNATERRLLALSPMGALSIAIVVNAQDLYSGPSVPWMVTAVIGGAFLTEIVVQMRLMRIPRQRLAAPRVP